MEMNSGISDSGIRIPHPMLGARINSNLIRSEIEGGVRMRDLPVNGILEIETQNRTYTLINRGNGEALLSGHPVFCPSPTRVNVLGSNWGSTMLKTGFIGRGMHLEFAHPKHKMPIVTSRITGIRQTR
jgi:hypothetical protein